MPLNRRNVFLYMKIILDYWILGGNAGKLNFCGDGFQNANKAKGFFV